MKRLIEFCVSFILATWLAGCAAIQSPLPVGQSLDGMRAVVNGQAGTFLYEKVGIDYLVMGWPSGQGYAFVMVDRAGKVLKDIRDLCATRCDWRSASDYVKWLETSGWTLTTSSLIAPAVAQNIRSLAYLIGIGRGLPSLMVIPTVILIDPIQLINPVVAQ